MSTLSDVFIEESTILQPFINGQLSSSITFDLKCECYKVRESPVGKCLFSKLMIVSDD